MGLMSTVTRIAGAAGSRRGAPTGGRRTTGTTGVGGPGTAAGAGGREAQMASGLLRKVLRKR
jgi:hypothetical protein